MTAEIKAAAEVAGKVEQLHKVLLMKAACAGISIYKSIQIQPETGGKDIFTGHVCLEGIGSQPEFKPGREKSVIGPVCLFPYQRSGSDHGVKAHPRSCR